MPTYVYECEKCGEFELHQSINDPDLKYCLTCDNPVRRIIQAVGIAFKGPGFYSTDNMTPDTFREMAHQNMADK